MNQAHGSRFPTNDYFWIGTYFEYLPDNFEFFEIVEDFKTKCLKINKTCVVVNGKKKRFAKPKRRQVFFPLDRYIYASYLKSYKGKEPFKNSPPTEEIITLAHKIQNPNL